MAGRRRAGAPTRDSYTGTITRRNLLRGAAASLLVGGLPFASRPSWAESPAWKEAINTTPAWFRRDVYRLAHWLPASVKTLGIDVAYQQRWNSFPPDVRAILAGMKIPPWMVALVPVDARKQHEILKQFRFMANLAGEPPASPIARRAEQLLIFGGAAQLPTPGDNKTGVCLGAEGCAAAISKFVLAQLKIEFPRQLAAMDDQLANSQSSVEMKGLFEHAARSGVVAIESRPFAQLRPADIQPGSLTIAQKPGGTHVFGWTRVPAGWHWLAGDKMAIGNTGLPQYGDHMILAQEYVSADPLEWREPAHNDHGPINSRSVIYINGEPDLGDPRTNVYAVEDSQFILVKLV